MNNQCTRAEVLAGAIALGEATTAERDEYRSHIASCAPCLQSLGGEREIERVMAIVAQAKEVETWEPVPRRLGERSRVRMRVFGTGAAVLAAALAISFGIHAVLATAVRPVTMTAQTQTQPVNPSAFHVALERRAPQPAAHQQVPAPPRSVAKAAAPAARKSLVVVHTTITRHGNAVTQTTTQTTEVADAPVPQVTAPASNVPIWRRGEAMPSQQHAVASTSGSPLPVLGGRAESIAVAPLTTIRDVAPVGGDQAINPRPAPIAYSEDAQGTTVFEVLVDERGAPTKCTITKSSGYLVLDVAVCKAAMAAHYLPRLVNGKPTNGVYRDAFTFRASNDDEGIPQQL